jgi:hypothetical protein
MDILLRVSVERVDGRNLSAAEVADHLCAELLDRGEDREGNIWVGGTRYRITDTAHIDTADIDTPPAGVRRRGTQRRITAIVDLADPERHS